MFNDIKKAYDVFISSLINKNNWFPVIAFVFLMLAIIHDLPLLLTRPMDEENPLSLITVFTKLSNLPSSFEVLRYLFLSVLAFFIVSFLVFAFNKTVGLLWKHISLMFKLGYSIPVAIGLFYYSLTILSHFIPFKNLIPSPDANIFWQLASLFACLSVTSAIVTAAKEEKEKEKEYNATEAAEATEASDTKFMKFCAILPLVSLFVLLVVCISFIPILWTVVIFLISLPLVLIIYFKEIKNTPLGHYQITKLDRFYNVAMPILLFYIFIFLFASFFNP
jgi:hypothetical protein